MAAGVCIVITSAGEVASWPGARNCSLEVTDIRVPNFNYGCSLTLSDARQVALVGNCTDLWWVARHPPDTAAGYIN